MRAGQALMSIESSGMADENLKVRTQEAVTDYKLAKAEHERKKALAADKIISQSDLLQAQRDLAVNLAQLYAWQL